MVLNKKHEITSASINLTKGDNVDIWLFLQVTQTPDSSTATYSDTEGNSGSLDIFGTAFVFLPQFVYDKNYKVTINQNHVDTVAPLGNQRFRLVCKVNSSTKIDDVFPDSPQNGTQTVSFEIDPSKGMIVDTPPIYLERLSHLANNTRAVTRNSINHYDLGSE